MIERDGEMSVADRSDAEVFQLLQQGDSAALGVLYDRYGSSVYRLALKILGKVGDAEDLTHEVFLILWQKGGYNPQRGSLLTFLLLLTRSRSINRLQRSQIQRRAVDRLERSLAYRSETPGLEAISLAETTDRVQDALQQLPSAQREILELSYYRGLSQSEIAEQIEIPLGTVKSRARQGLLKLRQLLSDLVDER